MRAVGRGVRYREQTRLARFFALPLKCSVGLVAGWVVDIYMQYPRVLRFAKVRTPVVNSSWHDRTAFRATSVR